MTRVLLGFLAGAIVTAVLMLVPCRRRIDDSPDAGLDLVEDYTPTVPVAWARSWAEYGRFTPPPPEWMFWLEECGGRLPSPGLDQAPAEIEAPTVGRHRIRSGATS